MVQPEVPARRRRDELTRHYKVSLATLAVVALTSAQDKSDADYSKPAFTFVGTSKDEHFECEHFECNTIYDWFTWARQAPNKNVPPVVMINCVATKFGHERRGVHILAQALRDLRKSSHPWIESSANVTISLCSRNNEYMDKSGTLMPSVPLASISWKSDKLERIQWDAITDEQLIQLSSMSMDSSRTGMLRIILNSAHVKRETKVDY